MSDTPKTWQQAKLLNAYYKKVALAAVGRGACPKFTTFKAGYDPSLIGPEVEGVPTVKDIPMSLSSIQNAFYTGTVDVQFDDKDTVLCVCQIPKGAVEEPTRFNVVGVFDQNSTLVAACTTLPDWLTPSELDRSYLSIAFPIEEESEGE